MNGLIEWFYYWQLSKHLTDEELSIMARRKDEQLLALLNHAQRLLEMRARAIAAMGKEHK